MLRASWRTSSQLKKLFTGLRPRLGSCWEGRKGKVFPRWGVINLPYRQINLKKNWVSGKTWIATADALKLSAQLLPPPTQPRPLQLPRQLLLAREDPTTTTWTTIQTKMTTMTTTKRRRTRTKRIVQVWSLTKFCFVSFYTQWSVQKCVFSKNITKSDWSASHSVDFWLFKKFFFKPGFFSPIFAKLKVIKYLN